jgi:hypothetical protein
LASFFKGGLCGLDLQEARQQPEALPRLKGGTGGIFQAEENLTGFP